MTTQDWFRRTTWSPADADDFGTRLSRARGQRSEYLRIQAITLAGTGNPAVSDPAVQLANQYLREKPKGINRAQVYTTIARALELKGDCSGVLDAYRSAIEEETLRPNVRCLAYVDFAWFVSTRDVREAYDEVMAVMETSLQEEDLVFPMTQYKYFGALALISSALGDTEHASRMARNALGAASKKEGPFPRHRAVGVVAVIDHAIARKIERLAG
jgi:hypothetical protein